MNSMDVKIADKDIALNACGDMTYIDCVDEIAQRVKIACSIRKGDFVYDRNLGSLAHTVRSSDPMLLEKLLMVFREACADIPYTDITVTKTEVENEKITATVDVYCGDDSRSVEVIVDADV